MIWILAAERIALSLSKESSHLACKKSRLSVSTVHKPERASSEAFGAHVLCGESLPHVRRHAEL